MLKIIVFAFSVFLVSFMVNAQTNDLSRVLSEIEQNNKELQAYANMMESRKLTLNSGNSLPDLQAAVYYLPWGDHNSGNYSEYQVSQSFEFPTVYGIRRTLIDKQNEQIQLEYDALRQKILLPAKIYMLELFYLNKRLEVEKIRVHQAKNVFEQVQELFDKEQVGILKLNKAKIVWMQEQFKIEQLEIDKRNIYLTLQNMNGGNEVALHQSKYTEILNLQALDSIWRNKQLRDPAIRMLNQQEEISLQEIKLSKSKSLPNLTLGFNYQGVSGFNYSGIYGGLSIPIWSSSKKVNAAEALYQYHQSYANVKSLRLYVDFQKQYNEYQLLLSKLQEYQSTLNGLNSDDLLFRAYELGEISYMEYYLELQFYQQAYDAMLKIENNLNQLKANILKHQL